MSEEIQELRIIFRYKYEDFKKAFLSSYFNNKAIIFSYCLLPIIFGGIIVYIFLYDTDASLRLEEWFLIFLFIAFIIIALVRPLSIIKIIQQQWLTSNQYNQNDIITVINNEGVTMSSIFGEQKYLWMYVYKIIEQKETFCIYFNSREYRIIPKRVLEAKQVTILRNFVIKNNVQKYVVQGFRKKKITETKLP